MVSALGPHARYDARMNSSEILHAAEYVTAAKSICILTGAGMSAESGISTFRDRDGLWSKFNPVELATPEAFARDPLKVWEWYRARRTQLREVKPHDGYHVLAAWQKRVPELRIVTQNVDGLHERAGSTHVIELHGRLDVARCVSCGYSVKGLDDLGEDPRCPECAARIRPGVVWFGEVLPHGAFEQAVAAVDACDVAFVIGTSGVVQPAASLADIVLSRRAILIEINPNESEISRRATLTIRSGCRAALTAINERLNNQQI